MLTMLLIWIVVGAIAGWLASVVVQGGGMGLLMDILVGILGAIVGSILLSALFPGAVSVTGFNLTSIVVAFVGAVVLLLIIRALSHRGYLTRYYHRR